MNRVVEVVTGPLYEPVSRAEVQRWLRISDDDPAIADHRLNIDLLRKSMRERAELVTGRAFIPRTYRMYLDEWPLDSEYGIKIVIPHPPLIEVTSFQYTDLDGNVTPMDAEDYSVHEEQVPGFIIPAWGESFPTVRKVPDAIRVTFRAGYAPGSPDDEAGYQEVLPASLKLWLASRCATNEQLREQVIAGTVYSVLPHAFADGLLDELIVGSRLFGN